MTPGELLSSKVCQKFNAIGENLSEKGDLEQKNNWIFIQDLQKY